MVQAGVQVILMRNRLFTSHRVAERAFYQPKIASTHQVKRPVDTEGDQRTAPDRQITNCRVINRRELRQIAKPILPNQPRTQPGNHSPRQWAPLLAGLSNEDSN